MKFVISFDEQKLTELGGTTEKAYEMVKELFVSQNLVCLAQGETIEFVGKGDENDYSNLWNTVFMLVRTNWFYECANQCTYYEDGAEPEDVLAQAEKIRSSSEF